MTPTTTDSVIIFALLIASTALVTYLAFLGRMRSRTLLVLMPAVTLVIASLTLLANTDSPLLPWAALGIATVAVALMISAVALLFKLLLDTRRTQKNTDSQNKTEPG